MKNILKLTAPLFAFLLMLPFWQRIHVAPTTNAAETPKPMLAIVIDDFGEDRRGVDQMLSVGAPLTCAIMPDLEFSTQDAERAHAAGHEVILHMPMEAKKNLPRNWYGPRMIHNYDNPEAAKKTFLECLESVPHAVGSNYHIGTGVSENSKLMKAILEVAKENNIYFLDSKTTMHSSGPDAAMVTGANFVSRDLFLEQGSPNYGYSKKILKEAVALAKQNGKAIVIGHVGPMGGEQTGKAILDSLSYIQNQGVQIVPLSTIVQNQKAV